MSPIIFLLAFNPVIQLAKNFQCPGFICRLPIANSVNLPCSGSTIYVEWNEPSSTEAHGWYRCTVSSYNSDGIANLIYPNQSSELINLDQINWRYARKTARQFRPLTSTPPLFTPSKSSSLKLKTYPSSKHKIKAFADDLTIISTSFEDHKNALVKIDSSCSDLDLHLCPDKCVSPYHLQGKGLTRKL